MHLWLALSPHGYGHAVMTAPLVAELRRRMPDLALTIQTALDRDFLETRYGTDFEHVAEIPDFGFRMKSAVAINLEASRAGYLELHRDWPLAAETEAERLTQAGPNLVLANVPYITLAGARLAGVPAVAVSSINWLDMYRHYLGGMPEAPEILAAMGEAYGSARVFLRTLPAMEMSLANRQDIGPLARPAVRRGAELRRALGIGEEVRVGLVAFGGIGHPLPLERWPVLDGWFWITGAEPPARPDMAHWSRAGLPFSDLVPSVDAVVTKPGYGTFTEAGIAGTPVLYTPRPDWPECPHLENWLARHAPCLPIDEEGMFDDRLEMQLRSLFAMETPVPASPCGVSEAADIIQAELAACGRS